ncbi:DNA topoisomerase IB [Aquimarina addita]|uniref:DNA topoisomerase n=1 Tax=Aquimarina addita TaxID=870485 RepID=A0ABP7X804_9FLAO
MENSNYFEKILRNPEEGIVNFNLVYIQDHQLAIKRLKQKDGFSYLIKNKRLSKKKELERIKKLVIPPAWSKVRICKINNGHLQAVGRDLKNRKQYRYHPLWNKLRNQTKFYKMVAFGKQLPKIRAKVDSDLELDGWPKNKVLALIIRLMEETHIRIGNEQYAKRNKTYGLSTLRTRHVKLYKDKIKFEFIGKKGKQHSITLRNKRLIRLVNRCEEIPGWELFQYYDQDGVKHSVDSSLVNEYLHSVSGELFSAKDFRTWAASTIAFEKLMDLGITENSKQKHKNILSAFDAAASGLGNTRNVCRKYYVHPAIIASYEDGSIQKNFNMTDMHETSSEYFTELENAMLHLLNGYTPEFLQ